MAGEIYIADKATLDAVKNTVEDIKAQAISVNKEVSSMSVTQLLTKLRQGTVSQNSVSEEILMLNVTTPGTLYFVVAGSNSCNMKVTVDGTVVYYRRLSGIYSRSGIIYIPSGTYSTEDYHFVSGSEPLGGDMVPTNGNLSNTEGVLVLPKPLKFKTLEVFVSPISGGTSETATKLDYNYILD